MSLTPQEESEVPSRSGRGTAIIAVVVAVSTLAALAVDTAQDRPLGDAPLGMIVVGCLIAIVTSALGMGRPLYLGLSAMAGFPVWAAIDMARNGGHNLLPFEFAFYALYAGLGVVVATVVTRVRRSLS